MRHSPVAREGNHLLKAVAAPFSNTRTRPGVDAVDRPPSHGGGSPTTAFFRNVKSNPDQGGAHVGGGVRGEEILALIFLMPSFFSSDSSNRRDFFSKPLSPRARKTKKAIR